MREVVFIFSRSRASMRRLIEAGKTADTGLFGTNHIDPNIPVRTLDFYQTRASRFLRRVAGHWVRQSLTFFEARHAPVIVGSALLYALPLKSLVGMRGKLILFNIDLNNVLNRAERRPLVYPLIRRLILREVDLIVSLATTQRDELRDRHGIPADKLRVLPLGVDVAFHTPVFQGRKDYILSCGRDVGRDYATVVRAAQLMPDREFHLLLDPRNLDGVTDIPSNVRLFPGLSAEEWRIRYREAGALLLVTLADGSSRGSDCSGQTVLLDAFASGVPVIATRKAYLRDYAREGEHLLLVEPGDAHGIKRAIEELQGREESISRRAREVIESRFTSVQMGEGWTKILREIMSGSSTG